MLPQVPNDPQTVQLRQALKQDIINDYNNSNIRFNAINPVHEDGLDETSDSLYKGLSHFAKEVIDNVPLIGVNDLVKENISKPTHLPPLIQIKNLEKAKKHNLPSPTESIEPKKRKADVSIQQDDIEKLHVGKLTELITARIGLTDEEAEYEHSDLWDEWSNTAHYLSNTAFSLVEDLLTKIINSSLINNVPLEVLNRIQVLALKSIKSASEIEWASVSMSDNSLYYAANALLASAVVLMIFNSQRNDKILQLDSYLVDVLSFVYLFVEDFLIRVINLEECDLKLLIPFMHLINKTFSYFKNYIPSHQVNDTIITKIEYLTILIIFTQWDKALLFFKLESSSLLLSIFQYKRSQRSFIIDEILNNFDSLPTHRVFSRQIVTQGSTSIQLFTHVLVSLVESVNIFNKDLKITLPSVFPKDVNDITELNSQLNNLSEDFNQIGSEVDDITKSICSILINKLIKNSSQTCKLQFQLFVVDLLNIVSFPEYSGSDSLLKTLMSTLLSVQDNESAIVESYLLELIGIIGSKMLEIRGIDEVSVSQEDLIDAKTKTYQYLLSLKKTSNFRNSADFFITKWVISIINNEETDDDLKLQKLKLYYNISRGVFQNSFIQLFSKSESNDSKIQIHSSYIHVLQSSDFIQLYDNFLNHLLKFVDHPKIKSRTRALKNLSLLISKDLSLLKIPQVKQAIASKMHDSSPLVRLAVLDIFDEYLIEKPEEFENFYQSILLTSDKSTAVRIKSIKIADRIYKTTEDVNVKSYIIEKIFKRLEDDEESVLELAQNTLLHLLFLPVFPNSSDHFQIKNEINSIIDVIISYINKSEKNWLLFENFLFTMVLRETSLNTLFHDKLMKTIGLITEESFNFVIDNMDTDLDVSKRLGLLSILATYDKQLISQDQLMALQTYFTNDSAGTDISLYSLMILRQTVSNATSLKSDFLEECEASLLKRLTRLNSRELSQAVPSLARISILKKDSSKLANAAASCLTLISPYLVKVTKGELKSFDPRCARLIFLIGNFAKDCTFEKDRSIFENKKFSLKKKETILSYMVKNLVFFTRSTVDIQLRKIAVKNLISVCSMHPNLFLSDPILKIFDDEFKGNQLEFQQVIVQGLLEFLERQEKISGKNAMKEENRKGKVDLDVDVFHGNAKMFENDGICASLVQRYIDPVLKLCLLEDGGISYAVVKYLKFIVIKGFCNPRLCVTTVIALQASPDQYIRGVGLQLFKDLFERYESLIDSSYIQGFKEAALFRSRSSVNILEENDQFLSKFYSVIEDSKSSKKKFLSQLVKSLDFDVNSMSLEEVKVFHDYFLFISINLAQCEFTYYDESITIIDGIQMILSDQSLELTNLIADNEEFLKDPDDLKSDLALKVGYLCAILISFERILNCLRQTYKIFENNEKLHELKNQKTKIHKNGVKLIKFDPNFDNVDTLIITFSSNK